MSDSSTTADVQNSTVVVDGKVTHTKSVQPRKNCVGCGRKIPRDSYNDICYNCYDNAIFQQFGQLHNKSNTVKQSNNDAREKNTKM